MSALAAIGAAGGVAISALGASSVAASRAAPDDASKKPLVVGATMVVFGAVLSVASALELRSSRPRRKKRRTNPSDDTADAYEGFHWGEPSLKEFAVDLPDYSELFALGKVTKIEYEASKGGEEAIWSHEFARPYPTLTATAGGELGPMVGGAAHVTDRGIEG